MDPFDEIEEKTRRKEKEIEAKEIKARLQELEKDLDQVPVTPTYRHEEIPSASASSPDFLQKISDVGKFCLIAFSVIVAIRVAAWVGFAIMMASVIWVSYKLVLEKKS